MTYQEYFTQLRNNFGAASQAYINAEKGLTELNGFFDRQLLERYTRARAEWQNAANAYNTFLDFWQQFGSEIDPNDIMVEL